MAEREMFKYEVFYIHQRLHIDAAFLFSSYIYAALQRKIFFLSPYTRAKVLLYLRSVFQSEVEFSEEGSLKGVFVHRVCVLQPTSSRYIDCQ